MRAIPGPGLPDRRLHPRPRGHPGRPTRPAAASSRCGPGPTSRPSAAARSSRSSITEIPYQVNKARLIERIAELVREKKLEGISDLRDESDREGIRIVVERQARRDPRGHPEPALQADPDADDLRDHPAGDRRQPAEGADAAASCCATSSTTARPWSSGARASTCARPRSGPTSWRASLKALDHLDEVIATIRSSHTPADAKINLMANFSLSDPQAQAILEMRLQRLTGLEREKIVEEYKELVALIERLRAILGSDKLVLEEIRRELAEIKEAYGDARRTEIVPETHDITIEDMIADEDMVITVTNTGYIKRSPLSLYRAQHRGGKGRIGMTTKEGDFVEHLFVASAHSYILVFTETRPRLLGQGARDPAARPGRQGQGDRQPPEPRPEREAGHDRGGARLPRRPLPRVRDREGHGQEDGALGVRQPARRRHHRDQHREGRPAPRRQGHRRQGRDPARHRQRLRRSASRRPTRGPWAATRPGCAACCCARTTGW